MRSNHRKGKYFERVHNAHRAYKLFFHRCKREERKRAIRRLPYENQKRIKYFESEKRKFHDYNWIKAPQIFSLVDNEEETLVFIKHICDNYKHGRKTFINLRRVKYIANDTLLLLLSNMIRFRVKHIMFNGNFPTDKNCYKVVKESGFLETLYDKIRENTSYNISGNSQIFHTHANKTVDARITSDIIFKASNIIWGEDKRCPGVQRTFIELMQNTNNHASTIEGEKHWWFSVTYDRKSKKVLISFLDFGMGIFRSLDDKRIGDKFYGWQDRLKKYYPWAKSNETRLRLILKGVLYKDKPATSTKDYKRGKGLPGIYRAYQNNDLAKLIVITNDVYADIEKQDFHLLKNEFQGTFVSWEINEQTNNLS